MDLGRRLGGEHLYDCASCAQHPALYETLGHDGPPASLWRQNLLTGADLPRCPVRELLAVRDEDPELSAEFDRYLGMYFPAYRDGHLLVDGGVARQPARYMQMMHAISDVANTVELKRLELGEEGSDG